MCGEWGFFLMLMHTLPYSTNLAFYSGQTKLLSRLGFINAWSSACGRKCLKHPKVDINSHSLLHILTFHLIHKCCSADTCKFGRRERLGWRRWTAEFREVLTIIVLLRSVWMSRWWWSDLDIQIKQLGKSLAMQLQAHVCSRTQSNRKVSSDLKTG